MDEGTGYNFRRTQSCRAPKSCEFIQFDHFAYLSWASKVNITDSIKNDGVLKHA